MVHGHRSPRLASGSQWALLVFEEWRKLAGGPPHPHLHHGLRRCGVHRQQSPADHSRARHDPDPGLDLRRRLGVRGLGAVQERDRDRRDHGAAGGAVPVREARPRRVVHSLRGMENSSAIFYAERPYVERRMGEGVVRHETAHQWFGDAVTERDWPHIWLSEGFATYFDGVIGAALDGDTVLVNSMRANAESYVSSGVTDRPIVDSGNPADPIRLFNANSYPKGPWVLNML